MPSIIVLFIGQYMLYTKTIKRNYKRNEVDMMFIILLLMVCAAKPEIGLVVAPIYLLYTLWTERKHRTVTRPRTRAKAACRRSHRTAPADLAA